MSPATRPTVAGTRDAPPFGLRRRFVLAISLLVAVVLIALTAVLTVSTSAELRNEIEAGADAFASLAAGPISTAYQTYFESGLTKFEEQVRATARLNPDLIAVRIYDVLGTEQFYANDLALVGVTTPGDPGIFDRARLQRGIRGLESDRWVEDGGEGQRYLVVEPHIEDWGRHRYTVVFTFAYDRMRASLQTAAWRILGLALLALALGVGCAFLLSAQSLGPLERLTTGARRFVDGDLDHRVDLTSGDEFQVLGDTFDRMAAKLSTTIADLERSNIDLARANDELQALDQMKSDLLASVSHELRTPLTSISGYVEALDTELLGTLENDQRKALQVVDRNLERLRRLIEQLLSFARMEHGVLELERRPFAFDAVARSVAEAMRMIHADDLDLRLELGDALPLVDGDKQRIAQVLENLLTNAVKFSPKGSPITLRAKAEEEGIEVEVADRGIGIPEDEQGQVFERFYQIDSGSKRKFGGVGLGLAIVREILRLHGSDIGLVSRPGEGTCFRFRLPIMGSGASDASEPTGRADATEPGLPPPRTAR